MNASSGEVPAGCPPAAQRRGAARPKCSSMIRPVLLSELAHAPCGPRKPTSRSQESQASSQDSSRGRTSVKRCGRSSLRERTCSTTTTTTDDDHPAVRNDHQTAPGDPACSGLGHAALDLLSPAVPSIGANIATAPDDQRIYESTSHSKCSQRCVWVAASDQRHTTVGR